MSLVSLFQQEWKLNTLCDIYDAVCINKVVIFCKENNKFHGLIYVPRIFRSWTHCVTYTKPFVSTRLLYSVQKTISLRT